MIAQNLSGEHIMGNNNRPLRSKDVAWILDCSPDEVVDLARSGELKATKVGRFWRYTPSAVQAYKRRQEREQLALRLSPFV